MLKIKDNKKSKMMINLKQNNKSDDENKLKS